MAIFSIAFKGSSLDNGTMNVNDLAPALIALNEICKRSHELLNGKNIPFNLKVASFEKGSFKIVLDAVVGVYQQITNLLGTTEIQDIKTILEWLGIVGAGSLTLIKLLKKTKGQKPLEVSIDENGNYTIITQTKEKIEISKEIFKLYNDIEIRKALFEITKPLKQDGVNSVIFDEQDSIVKEECFYFAVPELENSVLKEDLREQAFSIVSLSFKQDNKWRLSDGNNIFAVTINDKYFLEQVARNEISFSKDDILICQISIKSFNTNEGLRTEYEIIKIIDHKKAGRQGLLI